MDAMEGVKLNVIKTCQICGKEIESNKSICPLCQALENIKKQFQTCEVCGADFKKSFKKRTCSPKCEYELRRIQLEQKEGGLCFKCARAYAKPFESGGCNRFLYGEVCYNHASYWCYPSNKKLAVCIKVTDCDFYVRGRRVED